MKEITYLVDKEKSEDEVEWLNDQQIYPSQEETIDIDEWLNQTNAIPKTKIRLFMVVDTEQELVIKLRVPVLECKEWKRRK